MAPARAKRDYAVLLYPNSPVDAQRLVAEAIALSSCRTWPAARPAHAGAGAYRSAQRDRAFATWRCKAGAATAPTCSDLLPQPASQSPSRKRGPVQVDVPVTRFSGHRTDELIVRADGPSRVYGAPAEVSEARRSLLVRSLRRGCEQEAATVGRPRRQKTIDQLATSV